MTLKGYQLSFVPDVEPYWIENPEMIQTPRGTAKVTCTETIGHSQIIWADYGSGQEHPHQPEDVNVIQNAQPQDTAVMTTNQTIKSSTRKRYPKRGNASGWIETRTANPKRKKPNQYQVYRWEAGGKRHSRSLRKAIAPLIETMIRDGEPWSAIVERIEQSRKNQC